jgi:hypothetical protein
VSFLLRVGGIGTKGAAAADVTAPALVSAQIPAAGTTLEITFTESVKFGAGSHTGFTIALSGGAATLTYASGENTPTLVYTINRTVDSGETCSDFDYTQPTNGVEDIAGNDLASFSNQHALVTNNSTVGADVTAPVLSNPVDDNAGSSDGALTVDTDEDNGTLYWVISTSASAPSAAQVKAGQMHTGSAAADSGSQAVTVTGTQTISGESGLTPSTTYYGHFMHEDAATNQSTVASGNGFTTDAGGGAPGAVDDPTFSSITSTGFTVSWTGGTGADSFNVRYSVNSDMSSATTATGVTSPHPLSGLSDVTYYVVVDAINGSGTTSSSTVNTGDEMTMRTLAGTSMLFPSLPYPNLSLSSVYLPSGGTAATLNTLNYRCAFVGKVFLPGRTGTKTISSAGGKIYFQPSTTTFADASTTLRVGIQDLDDASGPPATPDGTFDVYDDLVGGTDTITTTTNKAVTMSSGTKDLTHGQKIAVVFDMVAKGGSDSVIIQAATTVSAAGIFPGVSSYNASSWTAGSLVPNVVLEFDDGTFGTIDGSFIFTNSNGSAVAFNSGSNPSERGNVFQVPFDCKIDGYWFAANLAGSSSTFQVLLYSDPLGTPAVVTDSTITFDPNNARSASVNGVFIETLPTEITLTAATNYAVLIKPTSANNVTVGSVSFPAAGARALWGGTNVALATRNGGVCSTTDTAIGTIGVRISGMLSRA